MAQCRKNNNNSSFLEERASAFTPKATPKGSITVEAAFAVSFFFLAILCVVCLFEMMALQLNIKSALHSVGKEIAEEAYLNQLLFSSRLENRLVEVIGEEKLNTSLVKGGSRGLDCSRTKTYVGSTIMDLCVYYQIEIPVLMLRVPIIAREEIIRIKGWSGDEKNGLESEGDKKVYVTEHGMVYHQTLTCTYLTLSIKTVPYQQVDRLRNENGGKYHACEQCVGNTTSNGLVYITEQGVRYHDSLECSGLKRKIYTIPITEIKGLGGCSKCVK